MNFNEINTSEMRPVRVLHVLPSLSVANGMLSVVENYQKHLDPAKARFDYLYFSHAPFTREASIARRGIRSFYLPFKGSKRPFRDIDIFFAQHEGEWDILHCHPVFTPQLYACAAKRHGIKHVVAHSHSTRFSDKASSAKRNKTLSHFLGFFATDYIACADDARILLGRHGKDAYIMRNAIEPCRFAFNATDRAVVRAELGVQDDVLLLGGVGRLAEQKNQQFMLVLLLGLVERGVNCKLAIAGNGDKEAFLRQRAKELGVENRFMLLGSRDDVNRLYSAFDVFLLTSLFEGLPVSAVEAQTAGLPCLLSDAITRDVDFGGCRFLPLDDENPWLEALVSIKNPICAERADGTRLAREAGFDIDIEARKLEDHYREIMER